ncbi:MAG TPA: hypothetical protein VN678_07565 [Acidobacteriaceae bacterium]|nr:hypothetical protein [Acidobacteriaceae bacterium]
MPRLVPQLCEQRRARDAVWIHIPDSPARFFDECQQIIAEGDCGSLSGSTRALLKLACLPLPIFGIAFEFRANAVGRDTAREPSRPFR